MPFEDRANAGAQLAEALLPWKDTRPIVAALPRGGVPVAIPVAESLKAPLTLIMVRKLGVPGHEEFAFGAIGEDGTVVVDEETVRAVGLSAQSIADVQAREGRELERRAHTYGVGTPLDFTGRTIIIVDDGLATGATMRAAVDVAHHRGAADVVVAVPVASREAAQSLAGSAHVIALQTPPDFRAVGVHYDSFPQVSDQEVTAALRNS
jgi:predicted phosphoribosyltransferase